MAWFYHILLRNAIGILFLLTFTLTFISISSDWIFRLIGARIPLISAWSKCARMPVLNIREIRIIIPGSLNCFQYFKFQRWYSPEFSFLCFAMRYFTLHCRITILIYINQLKISRKNHSILFIPALFSFQSNYVMNNKYLPTLLLSQRIYFSFYLLIFIKISYLYSGGFL